MPELQDDALYEQMVAQVQEDWEKAEVQDGRWNPPAGDYTVQLVSLNRGVAENDDGERYLWVSPRYEIKIPPMGQENLEGRTFSGGFFRTLTPGDVSRLKTILADLLGGKNVLPPGLDDAIKAVEAAADAGVLLDVRVREKAGKNGRMYTNVYVQQVHATPADGPVGDASDVEAATTATPE